MRAGKWDYNTKNTSAVLRQSLMMDQAAARLHHLVQAMQASRHNAALLAKSLLLQPGPGACGACGACGARGISGACGICGARGAWGDLVRHILRVRKRKTVSLQDDVNSQVLQELAPHHGKGAL